MVVDARDRYLDSLAHIESAYGKITGMVGRHGRLSFPDVHKLTEGLFLSAWTYWEGFLRQLLWIDLSESSGSSLRREVRQFRTGNAPYRLAELILNHPDHPEKFVEWSDYNAVVKRANQFLGPGHRFVSPLPQGNDIAQLKRLRNAIAHKSDRAWESFMDLVKGPPFSLTGVQRRGLTPGRFLYSHQWQGASVMQHSVTSLRAAATALVP